jgi:hypothetical protein
MGCLASQAGDMLTIQGLFQSNTPTMFDKNPGSSLNKEARWIPSGGWVVSDQALHNGLILTEITLL